MLTEASEQPSMVEVGEMTAAPDPSIASQDLASKPSSRVAVVQPLINLEEEPVAIDVKEESEAIINPIVIQVSNLQYFQQLQFYIFLCGARYFFDYSPFCIPAPYSY